MLQAHQPSARQHHVSVVVASTASGLSFLLCSTFGLCFFLTALTLVARLICNKYETCSQRQRDEEDALAGIEQQEAQRARRGRNNNTDDDDDDTGLWLVRLQQRWDVPYCCSNQGRREELEPVDGELRTLLPLRWARCSHVGQ